MSRLITSLWFLDTVPHNTTGDETALNEDKYGKLISFNHTVVDETSSSINPGLTLENGIKQNVLRIAFKEGSLLCKNTKFAILYLTYFRPAHLMGPSTSPQQWPPSSSSTHISSTYLHCHALPLAPPRSPVS